MLLSFNWIVDLNWIIRYQSTLQAKWKGNTLLSSVVTSMLSILPTFLQYIPILSIYILHLFRTLRMLEKSGSKLDKKRSRFSTLRAPALTLMWFYIVFSHWNAYNQDPKKTVNAFFFFSNSFWIICFWQFSFKMWFQNLSKYCRKSWITHYDSVFLFALLSDGKSTESVPIENVQGLRGQISRFSWQN